MLHIAIFDNKIESARKIKQILSEMYHREIRLFVCESIFALENYVYDVMKGNVDIIFVGLSGQSADIIAKITRIQEECLNIQVTFVVEAEGRGADIFEANPAYCMVKPVNEEQLQKAMNRMLVRLHRARKELWAFEGQKGMLIIPKEEILYVESNRREITVVLTGNRQEKGSGKMAELEESLGEGFIRCHQSYIVNAAKIWSINNKEITLHNHLTVPVSRPRQKETRVAILKYIVGE